MAYVVKTKFTSTWVEEDRSLYPLSKMGNSTFKLFTTTRLISCQSSDVKLVVDKTRRTPSNNFDPVIKAKEISSTSSLRTYEISCNLPWFIVNGNSKAQAISDAIKVAIFTACNFEFTEADFSPIDSARIVISEEINHALEQFLPKKLLCIYSGVDYESMSSIQLLTTNLKPILEVYHHKNLLNLPMLS